MTTATIRWANPLSTTASSRFRIEISHVYDLSGSSASQMATSPYASPSAFLTNTVNYGASTFAATGLNLFSASGYIVMEDALIGYGSNGSTNVDSASWFSGYGAYAQNTILHQAHENYSFTYPATAPYAVAYTIKHVNNNMEVSRPSSGLYISACLPGNHSKSCKVIIPVATSVDTTDGGGTEITARINSTRDFLIVEGKYIKATEQPHTTDALGYAEVQCWKNSAVEEAGGGPALGYTFVVNGVTLNAPVIPDMDYVMLKDIVVA